MVTTGHIAPPIESISLSGNRLMLSDFRGRRVFVKFHRFSGCPVARRQVGDLIAGGDRLAAHGIETIVVFHSGAEDLRPNFSETAHLHIVPDPEKMLFRAYGCDFDWHKLFSSRSWGATLGAFGHGYFPQPTRFHGGVVGIPADFLIDATGVIVHAHYGSHFGDSLTTDDVLGRFDC